MKKYNQKVNSTKPTGISTSWGKEALWYDRLLSQDDTYQAKVILPNLIRILGSVSGRTVVELGCGQGFFCFEMQKLGARVIGVDIGKELIRIADKRAESLGISGRDISFYTASADDASCVASKGADIVVVILALQNMKDLSGVVAEMKRVVKNDGRVIIVLNHPTFRVPRQSDWGYDEASHTQYRKISKYLSQFEVSIDMHPGQKTKTNNSITKSFHRSLQDYAKAFAKEGFAISKIEEWISHKESQKGPRQIAEDRARKEIPLFMMLELRNLKQG